MNIQEEISKLIAKINAKNPYYMLGGILLVIFLLDYFLIVQFQFSNLRSINPKISAKSQEFREAKKNIEQLGQYNQQVKDLKEKRNQVSYRVKSKDEIPLILEHISRIANKNNVKVEQMMPITSSQKEVLKNNEGKYFSVPISVEAVSSYHDLGRFLYDLEFGEEFLSISNFTISANPADTAHHFVYFTIMAIILEKV